MPMDYTTPGATVEIELRFLPWNNYLNLNVLLFFSSGVEMMMTMKVV